ncbi:uncharacterized protein PG986_009706 [Apiospora aurea]|uniref:Uncharacterized protein n=1 Tax=Apiospora aurea TaxID=335848 RepID=A0ABR1Q8P0_9PEZI
MAPGKSTAGRDARKAQLASARSKKRAASSTDADNAASANKRRKSEGGTIVVEVDSDDKDSASEYEDGLDDASPPPPAKRKGSKRGSTSKGKAPANAESKKTKRQPRPKKGPVKYEMAYNKDHNGEKMRPYLPGSFRWVEEGTSLKDAPRMLLSWNRDRMYEKLLLNMFYECGKAGFDMPWDKIAHRLDPGTSKEALLQAMERLRQTVLAEGHIVPPEVGTKDPWTRGFTRVHPDSFEDIDILYCRPVGWLEKVDHPKEKNPTAERLTFNGQYKFKIDYASPTAPIPEEFMVDPEKRRNEVRLSAADVIAQAGNGAQEDEDDDDIPSSYSVENNSSDAIGRDEDGSGEDEVDEGEDEKLADGTDETGSQMIKSSPANSSFHVNQSPVLPNTPQQTGSHATKSSPVTSSAYANQSSLPRNSPSQLSGQFPVPNYSPATSFTFRDTTYDPCGTTHLGHQQFVETNVSPYAGTLAHGLPHTDGHYAYNNQSSYRMPPSQQQTYNAPHAQGSTVD